MKFKIDWGLTLLLVMCVGVLAAGMDRPAHSKSLPPNPQEEVGTNGIITPVLATGFKSYSYFNVDLNGELVVCPTSAQHSFRNGGECEGARGPNAGWVPVRHVVPAGKTFVGFRSVYHGGTRVEIYWK